MNRLLISTFIILVVCSVSYAQPYTVERVIDGDTIVVTTPEGNAEEVQLIGVKAPEDEKMGQEATEFTQFLIEGEKVILEFDVEKKDKYGRLLAYVHVYGLRLYYIDFLAKKKPKSAEKLKEKIYISTSWDWDQEMHGVPNRDGYGITHFLNATIIKSGYATPMTIPPNVKHADLFKSLYEEARKKGRGLWSDLQENEKFESATYNVPISYSECINTKEKYHARSKDHINFKCSYLVDGGVTGENLTIEDSKQLKRCVELGGLQYKTYGVSCELNFYNPSYKFPKNYNECVEEKKGEYTSSVSNRCLIDIIPHEAYNKDVADQLMNLCLKLGGSNEYRDEPFCLMVFKEGEKE